MSRKIIVTAIVTAALGIIFTSCSHEPDYFGPLTDTVCFSSQVLPLLQNSCGTSGCHDAATANGGFIASDYQEIMKFVTAGDPRGSQLYQVLADIRGKNLMPPGNPLSVHDRNLIQVWIAQGALPTLCEPGDGNGGTPPFQKDTVCFQQDILPILLSSCATSGCHDAVTATEGFNFSSWAALMGSEEAVVPFDPEESELYQVITEDDIDDRMPPYPRSPLTQDQIEKIRRWITTGALNSDCPENTCDTLSVIGFASTIFPVFENNCISCHNPDLANGGVLLNNYENIRSAAETMRNGISLISGVLNGMNGFSSMPPGNPLNSCTVRTVELWIGQGVQNN